MNHQAKMGAGLAKQIATKWPAINSPHSMYQSMCKEMKFVDIKTNGLVAWFDAGQGKTVASIFGQNYYGTDKQYTDYVALGTGLESVRLLTEDQKLSVAIPSGIGCRLGGGDWSVVLNIIEQCFVYSPSISVSIYKYE